ncbi:hypothetical protein ACOMHN_044583 [Nucella lapillus]
MVRFVNTSKGRYVRSMEERKARKRQTQNEKNLKAVEQLSASKKSKKTIRCTPMPAAKSQIFRILPSPHHPLTSTSAFNHVFMTLRIIATFNFPHCALSAQHTGRQHAGSRLPPTGPPGATSSPKEPTQQRNADPVKRSRNVQHAKPEPPAPRLHNHFCPTCGRGFTSSTAN